MCIFTLPDFHGHRPAELVINLQVGEQGPTVAHNVLVVNDNVQESVLVISAQKVLLEGRIFLDLLVPAGFPTLVRCFHSCSFLKLLLPLFEPLTALLHILVVGLLEFCVFVGNWDRVSHLVHIVFLCSYSMVLGQKSISDFPVSDPQSRAYGALALLRLDPQELMVVNLLLLALRVAEMLVEFTPHSLFL